MAQMSQSTQTDLTDDSPNPHEGLEVALGHPVCKHATPEPSRSQKLLQCLASVFCCCCRCCSPPCPASIINTLAFFPPKDLPYHFTTKEGKLHIEFKNDLYNLNVTETNMARVECFFAYTKKDRVACCTYRCLSGDPFFTILYSHGNAQDMGTLLGMMVQLAEILNCDVVAYDYSGYGESTGKPTERALHDDIVAVYEEIQRRYNLAPDRIIVYGQSIGTVPSAYLASRHPAAGVVLHSGLTSAFRLLKPTIEKTHGCDQFASIDRVGQIKAPTLVMHGTNDEVIPVVHGVLLYRAAACPVAPLWIEEGNHNNLESFADFWLHLIKFVQFDLLQKPEFHLNMELYVHIHHLTSGFPLGHSLNCTSCDNPCLYMVRQPFDPKTACVPKPAHEAKATNQVAPAPIHCGIAFPIATDGQPEKVMWRIKAHKTQSARNSESEK